MSKQPTIEIFRAGTHTAMDGTKIAFSAADIEAIAKNYDPALHEAPAVIGHPKTDAPAYAWAKTLSADGGKLSASLDQVDPQFAEMVKAGRFKKISASFYSPDAASNPVPGSYYLQHVGFLGAQAPSVKGLKQVEFAGNDEGVISFAEAFDWSWPMRSIETLFRAMRDYIISKDGLDAANAAMPDWSITSIGDAASRAEAANQTTSPAYAEPTEKTLPTAEELKAREDAVKAREDKIAEDAKRFAEADKTRRATEDAALIDQLVKDGKFAPAAKVPTLAFMAALDASETVQFAEAGDKQTARDFFRDLLGKAGKIVSFAEMSKGDVVTSLPSDHQEAGRVLADEAVAFMEEKKKSGVTVTLEAAMQHVVKTKELKS